MKLHFGSFNLTLTVDIRNDLKQYLTFRGELKLKKASIFPSLIKKNNGILNQKHSLLNVNK